MKKEYRVKKNEEIDKIIKARKSVGNLYFVIYRLKNNETAHFRAALSIGKKFGIAVKRNRIKRQIRNIITENKELLKNDDYVFVIKPKARELDFSSMQKMIKNLLERDKK